MFGIPEHPWDGNWGCWCVPPSPERQRAPTSVLLPSLLGVCRSRSPHTWQPLTSFTSTEVLRLSFSLLWETMDSSFKWAPNLHPCQLCVVLPKLPRISLCTSSLLSVAKYCLEVITQQLWLCFSCRLLLCISLAWKLIGHRINCFPLSRNYSLSCDVTVSCPWAKYLKVFRCLKMQVMWIFRSI